MNEDRGEGGGKMLVERCVSKASELPLRTISSLGDHIHGLQEQRKQFITLAKKL